MTNRLSLQGLITFSLLGQGALAGAAVLGLGGLAYYGLGLSNGVGAIEKQMVWPQYVKDRIR